MANTDFLYMDSKARVYTSARKGAGGKPVTDVEITNKATVKDVFSGSSTVTKTYTDQMEYFAIQNKGANALTVSINGLSIPVDANEGFENDFDPFTTVTVTATTSFKALVKGKSNVVDTTPTDITDPIVTVSPNGGSFVSSQQVTLSANESAIIYYTLDGTTPTESSPFYISPITISATTTLKYFAVDDAGNSSSIQTVTYTKQATDTTPPTVSASPNGGTFTGSQQVTLSANETATIYYTIDGTNPTTSSLVYSSPITITNTLTLKFFARDSAGNESAIESVTYTKQEVADTTAPVLTITPATTFTNTQTVTMSTNETATIWYTLDESDPISSGTRIQYTSPLTLTETDTIKAYAVDTAGNSSAVQSVTYTKESSPINADYIYMNGSGDKLQLPSFQMDTIEIDMKPDLKTSSYQYYLDARTGGSTHYFMRDIAGGDLFSGGSVYKEEVLQTSGSTVPFIQNGARLTYKFQSGTPFTDNVTIFAKNTGEDTAKGSIYSVKCYLSGTLVAHYDMSTGTVQDQSGNGRHATLTGGTWMQDTVVDTLQSNHILLNGTTDKVLVPIPLNTKYISLKMKRLNNDLDGFILDARPVQSSTYIANDANSGFVDITFDGVVTTSTAENHLSKISTTAVSDILVELSSAISVNGNITIGSRNTTPTATSWLNAEVHDIKFYNASMTLLEEFNFNNGISDKALHGKLLSRRGEIFGMWVQNA